MNGEELKRQINDACYNDDMYSRYDLVDAVEDIVDENSKLRELCADMWHVMWACAEQRCKHRENECYVVNGNNGALPSHDECWYKRRMRELGVEVDA